MHTPDSIPPAGIVPPSAASGMTQLALDETMRRNKHVPEITSGLKSDVIHLPGSIRECSGIRIHGRRIKSFIFTTDIAIILNNNADAVLAVYPFTPSPAIIQAITSVAPVPVLAGVGGGTTQGPRSAQIAMLAEAAGCLGVVVNAPTPLSSIRMIREVVDCPIIGTIVSLFQDIQARIDAGVNIINVSGGKHTTKIVAEIRERYPKIPMIATGGTTDASIRAVIRAGANAITYTPPNNGELFRKKMDVYRDQAEKRFHGEHSLT